MAQTWRPLIAAGACAVTVLYGGYAFALPHAFDPKWGHDDSDSYGDRDWDKDREWGADKKGHNYKKPDWDEYDPKPQWFVWNHDKDDEKWGNVWGKDKDPDCDPMTPSPEPSTLLLLGSSLTAVGVAWPRRRAKL